MTASQRPAGMPACVGRGAPVDELGTSTNPRKPHIGSVERHSATNLAHPCGPSLAGVGDTADNESQDTTKTSRPPSNGVGAPLEGLANR